tara:strand:- start:186 stop:368 length:183 start_codon:yes stop_codon:yes gene_type:complete
MESYNNLFELVSELHKDVEKFHVKGNDSAGVRIRKAMQDLKALAQDIRDEIQDIRKKRKD